MADKGNEIKMGIKYEPNSKEHFAFEPGHLLKGTVLVSLESATNIEYLKIEFSGKGHVNWMEHETRYVNNGQGQQVATFHNSNHYDFKTYLLDSILLLKPTNGSTIELQPGIHYYEFSLQLPDDLPSTLILGFGDILYTATDILKTLNNSEEEEVQKPLIILRECDLNSFPSFCVPQKFEDVKSFFYFCCASGPFSMTATIPSTGFCVGLSVPITIDYVNKSNVEVRLTKFILKRTVVYKAMGKSKVDSQIMLEVHADGVKSKNSNSFVTFLEIPDDFACSTVELIPLISISYTLDIIGEAGKSHLATIFSFPVVIGNVPISLTEALV